MLATDEGELAAGDLNSDGMLDFVVSGSENISFSLQQSDHTYASFSQLALPGSACPYGSAHDVHVADADGNGLDDLIAVKPCDRTVYTWLQQPGGILSAPQLAFDAELVARAVFADVTADGRTDLILINSSFPTPVLIIAAGQADGTFVFRESLDDAGGPQTTGAGVGDFNGDGREDIVRVSGEVAWLHEQQADGSWQARSLGAIENNVERALIVAVEVTDLDNDGDSDLAMCDSGRDLWVGAQQPNGSFVYNIIGVCRQDTVGITNSMAVMDVNDDGYPDIIGNSDSAFRNNTNQTLFARVYLGGLTGYSRSIH